ncbi:TAXI family TRAP transporter solute-binding subunit [Bradyrhizobium sp.]|uniref:TAXI family TRAP transporter solute-binding subunit n=1 Tax=Bradyrhizobium sp. TaxID=376 RepID=UPI003C419DD6
MRGTVVCVLAATLAMAASNSFSQTARSGPVATAAALGEGSKVRESNEWTVGIAGGLLEGTNIRFAAEMAKVLDDRPRLRVLPIVTYGALGNVEDLLYLKGVDVTITSADVLDQYVKNGTLAHIKDRIRFISKFYLNEVHIYVRPEIKTLDDLVGKKVSFNTVGSAANLTGAILFERLQINAEKVFINNSIALEKMRTGEIAGIVHVTGKPTDLFTRFKPEPGFHFLPVPFSNNLLDYYVPTKLTSADYPNLIPPGQSVDTIAVPQVLAVYNWPPNTDRYGRVARFVEYFFDRFDQFQKPPFHPKWKEVNLSASVPGWTRFRPAQEMLAKRPKTEQPARLDAPGTGQEAPSADQAPDPRDLLGQFRSMSARNPGPGGRVR